MPKLLARFLVFVTSAAVLILEILAGRLLAPYLGVSLQVFTGIIGVILAGIAVGSWAGGRWADRGDARRLIGPLLVAGGIASMTAPLIVDLVGPGTTPEAMSILLMTALGFFVPAAVLSAVPPVVVKIQLRSLERTGSIVGTYSAIGTAGALFGTFLTGFVLISAFPTRPIVIGVGVALSLLGLGLWVGRSAWAVGGTLGIVALTAFLLVRFDWPCHYETSYHCAEVVVDPSRPTGRLLLLDAASNSYVDLADPTHLEFRYLRVMVDVIDVESPPGALDVVSIGGGGFTLPGYLDATRPGTSHVILEIDESLVAIGEEQLGFDGGSTVVIDDARRSIDGLPAGAADVVVGDAFSGLTVPWHLTTVEFVRRVADRLTPEGVYTINVIDRSELGFARAEVATLLQVFDHVVVLAPPEYLSGVAGGNFVLVGSAAPIDVPAIEAAIRRRGGVEIGITGRDLEEFVDGARPLVDDFAPVDQLIAGL